MLDRPDGHVGFETEGRASRCIENVVSEGGDGYGAGDVDPLESTAVIEGSGAKCETRRGARVEADTRTGDWPSNCPLYVHQAPWPRIGDSLIEAIKMPRRSADHNKL